MTTNSPNQVDGDVQAYIMPALTQAERKTAIDSCVAEISHLERCIKAYPDQPVLKVDLLVQQVALAALTAEPVADVVTWIHPHEERRCAVQLRKFDLVPGHLYTTPPAQPVSDWQKEAERMAELHGMSFVVFRNGDEPKCADPTKVRIEFTDKGLGYPAAPGCQDS